MKIIAHRGNTQNEPENTLSSFRSAVDNGADAVELDIHMTNDGKVVVHHDYYLGNPDDGYGMIHSSDSTYIKGLRIKPSEHIPLLEEVFELIGDKVCYEIELKGFTQDFLDKTIELVKTYKLLDQVEFTSPHPYALTYLKTLEPLAKTGMFVTEPPEWMEVELAHTLIVKTALLGNVDVVHCPVGIITRELVTLAHANSLEVHAANCDSEHDVRVAQSTGVDQLSTNQLALVRSLL